MDGVSIEAEITELKEDGSAYDPVTNSSDTFRAEDVYDVTVDSVAQNGDVFDVTFSVTNAGNLPAAEGVTARLYLAALYGGIKELYGMDDDLLISEDITGLEPRETRTFTRSIELPLSVFEFCGYDALNAAVKDGDDFTLAVTDDVMFGLEYPIHLSLNEGNDITLNQGDSQSLTTGYETDLFVDVTEIVYSVDDTSVASVDENGVITALGKGITTVTATLLPSGRTISITLTVLGENGEKPEPTPEPTPEPQPGTTPSESANTSDSFPIAYLYTGGFALLIAAAALYLRLKKRES